MDYYKHLPKGIEKTLQWILSEYEVVSWRLFEEQTITLSIKFAHAINMSSTPYSNIGNIAKDNQPLERTYRSKPPSSIKRDNVRLQTHMAKLGQSPGSARDSQAINIANSNGVFAKSSCVDEGSFMITTPQAKDAGYVSCEIAQGEDNVNFSQHTDMFDQHVKHSITQTQDTISKESQTDSIEHISHFSQCPNMKKQYPNC